MTNSVAELNDMFDLLYNNLANDGAANIDMFEKSQIFTKAQEEVVYNHLQAQGNKYQQGAEASDKRMLELAPLLKITDTGFSTITSNEFNAQAYIIDNYNINNYIKILNEVIILKDKKSNEYRRQVVPVSYGEYERYVSKPGGEPLKNQVWKVSINSNTDTHFFVFNYPDYSSIANNNIKVLTRGYIKPTPIIFENLSSDLWIDGQQLETDFYLPMLKNEIIQRAVEIAKGSYGSDDNGTVQLQNQMTLGQRSE